MALSPMPVKVMHHQSLGSNIRLLRTCHEHTYELLPVWSPSLGCFTISHSQNGAVTVQPGVQTEGDSAGEGAYGFGGSVRP